MVAVNYVDNLYDLKFLPPESSSPVLKQANNETMDYNAFFEKLNIGSGTENLISDVKCKDNMTTDTVFNFSLGLVCDLIKKSQQAKVFFPETEMILIVVYSILMASGIVSNLLVCFVVMRQCARRKTDLGSSGPKSRNLYIVNLAVADLALCCICMPFTLICLLQQRWTLGSLLCKLVPVVQGKHRLKLFLLQLTYESFRPRHKKVGTSEYLQHCENRLE